jgi:dynein heavy chain, axonemal
LDEYAVEKLPEIMLMDFDDANGNGQAQRGYEPLFYLNVNLNDSKPIPDEEIGKIPIDEFILPPRGTSKEEDFDLLCHLEIEEVKPEGEEEDDDAAGDEPADVPIIQLYRRTLPSAHKYWIKLEPSAEEFNNQIISDFTYGLDKIQCFTRWSKHGDLKNYADALEEWDDIVGEKWEEPESLTLNPHTWIVDTPTYRF